VSHATPSATAPMTFGDPFLRGGGTQPVALADERARGAWR
jgi:hypothetical protein